MSEHTPTTEAIRAGYAEVHYFNYEGVRSREEYEAEFDLWLAEERAEARREALREAAGDFAFTDDMWRNYQGLPDQGYSHRDFLEHVVGKWLRDRAAKLEGK